MMNKNVNIKFGIVLLTFGLTFLSGCGCQKYSSKNQSSPAVEFVPSKNIKILWADSHRVEGNVLIHGTFRRRTRGSVPMQAHIDVQMLAENGDIIQEIYTPDVYVPRNQVGKGIKLKRFEVELNDNSAAEKIILKAHQGRHDRDV